MEERPPILLSGGRVVDPAAGFDGIADVLVSERRVAGVGAGLSVPAGTQTLNTAGKLVVPGLIDLHCHVYYGGTMIGVEPDLLCLPSGVTTAIDLGTAGADNFIGLRRFVLEPAITRVISFLHVASIGLVNQGVGEMRDNAYAHLEKAISTVEAHRDCIGGLKVRLGGWITGDNTAAAFAFARQVRDAVALPLAVHIGSQPVPLPLILEGLNAGDIVTHIFKERATLNGIFGPAGRVLPEVYAAQRRGVLFDVGHGSGSFAFEGARCALAEGFRPNSISTDAYAGNLQGPVFDLPTTMSKFLALGMPLEEIIPRVTANPAGALAHCSRAAGIGTFHAGSAMSTGDVTVLEVREGRCTFQDSRRQTLEAERRIVPVATIRAGRLVWHEEGYGE